MFNWFTAILPNLNFAPKLTLNIPTFICQQSKNLHNKHIDFNVIGGMVQNFVNELNCQQINQRLLREVVDTNTEVPPVIVEEFS